MPIKRLSAAFVRTIKDPGKYYDINGLFLRVEPSGTKRWVQRLTIRGRLRELGLGSADLVTLADARAEALSNRQVARSGGDPIAARQRDLSIPTFESAAREVHSSHTQAWKNKKHAAQFVNTLQTYAFPKIGSKPVSDVDTSDILAVLTPIWTTKAETARRVRQRIGTVMKWAVAKGYRQDDPTASIQQALPKVQTKPKHRKALPYDEVSSCLSVIQASGAGPTTKLALELLILTAARSGEVRSATWSEIDLEAGEWTVRAERMKAGIEHRVPLASRAVEVLHEASALSDGGELVFPGTRPGRPLSDMTLSKLVKSLGYEVDVHGFRTSFRTWAQEQTSVPREIVEKALAHTIRNKAEAAYARSDLFEKRRHLMQAWSEYLEGKDSRVVRLEVSA